jgi:hypothetical protein
MEDLDVKIHLCTKKELEEEAEEHGSKPWYRLQYLRGFRYGNEIWVVKDCFGELALLAHEYGHIRGRKHCRFPSIMNFSGLFRLFAFHPFEIAKLVRQR